MKGQDEPERRRLKVLLTWTPPRTRSWSPPGAKLRPISASTRRSDAEAVCRDELWEAMSPRSRSMSPQGRGRSPSRQEKVSKRPHMCSLEREKIGRAWNIMDTG